MKNISVEARIERLKKVYLLYDEAIEHEEWVCREKCASCCTCNVTLTSLEAALLITSLTPEKKEDLKSLIAQRFPEKRYIPKMTSNMFAGMCMTDTDIPEEKNDPAWGTCPLLDDGMCGIYDVRPFGCRALMSQVDCRQKGYARIPPVVLTLNTVFLQIIEQLDEHGFFGNLSDMLPFLLSNTPLDTIPDRSCISRDERFLFNEKVPVLMVPPEHQEKIRPFLERLLFLVSNR